MIAPARPRPCPDCGEPVQPGDRFCERCGRERPAAPGRPGAHVTGRCVDCGAVAVDAEGYCCRCGLRQPTGREHREDVLSGPDGRVAAAGVSDVGRRRRRNEDAFALSTVELSTVPLSTDPPVVCAVVCDGVATAPGSDEASRVAAETGAAVLARRLAAGDGRLSATRAAIGRAAEAVAALAVPGPSGSPACTYVSVLVDATSVTVGSVGDSRAYWIPAPSRGATPCTRLDIPARPRVDVPRTRVATVEFAPRAITGGCALTRDDSWAEEMVRSGAMSPEAAHADRRAHLLTGWLGADAGGAEADVAAFAPNGPGTVLVCSDGLWNYLPAAADLAAVLDRTADPVRGVRALLDAALEAGGRDNVTVVLIPFPLPGAVSGPDAATPGGRGSAGTEGGPRASEKGAGGAGRADGTSDGDSGEDGPAYAPMPYEPTTRAVSGMRPATSRETRR
ncbi:PP2C family serine/threonine-protein phosphatase [Actinomadura harenae]|uniref:Zinc-ribbon domain-containing protein n=1 Tax=Actinomadura harenae TaxID=2483351 RepID=A0A3M2LY02_9ACTN|nr:protein phosphatase 2C domain-containing protein [Actinomadura harenae]RMI42016.1 zinc-ribbon domain-containing protein [Actinomadura harenae]